MPWRKFSDTVQVSLHLWIFLLTFTQLNTLANHGYLPRDGRNISRDQLVQGFLCGWGMDESTIDTAIHNAFSVCINVTRADCTILPNLEILAEPHMFEHDHSLSRQDAKMAYAGNVFVDNNDFNQSVFDTSLNVLGQGASHMTIAQANEVRLERESLSLEYDFAEWFAEAKPPSEFEVCSEQ